MKKNIILLSVGVMALGGCAHDEAYVPSAGDAVNFTAGIETLTRTTDGGNAWMLDDQAGVYMLTAGGDIATTADLLAENVPYKITNAATGALAPVSTPILYPQSGTVDFAAYYPYATVTGGLYNIGIAGQTSETAQNSLDVLYAKKSGVAKTKTAVGLVFGHVLSKVTLDVTLGDGLSALTGADVTAATLDGMPLTATLDLQDGTLTAGATTGTFVALKSATPTTGAAATFTALVVPHSGATGRTVTFTVDGTTYTGTFPAGDAFEGGNHYSYPVTVRKTAVEIGNYSITPWTPHNGGTVGGSTTTGHYHEGYYYTAEAWRFIQWAQLTDGWKSSGFTLASDIDLTGFDWTPVGDGATQFTQPFDGGGYAITGLSVNSNTIAVGLFGYVGSGGEVRNVKVSGTVAGTGSRVGGIVGVNYGPITGCSFSGTVTGTGTYVGGIVGTNYGPITGCSFSGTVTGTGSNSYVGGIAGGNVGYETYNGSISGCSVGENSTIEGSGSNSYVGGIAGANDRSITGSWSAAKSVTGRYVGGIAGNNSYATIQNCHWLWDGTNGLNAAVGVGSADASCSSFATVAELNGKVPGMNSAISSSGWLWTADTPAEWPKIVAITELATPVGEANCYMVKPDDDAILIPVSQANRVLTADGLGATTTGLGGVAAGNFTVELVWGDTPVEAGGVIEEMFAVGDYVYVKPGAAGNAVICVKVGGTVKWSWHIWVTQMVMWTTDTETGIRWMDRNLGAQSNDPAQWAKTLGLYYQWGRKDAFPGSDGGSTIQQYYTEAGGTTPTNANPTGSYTDLPDMVQNPLNFATNNDSFYGSLNVAGGSNDSWGGVSGAKTLYDPCPEGWRVPESGKWSSSNNDINGFNSEWAAFANNGRVFSGVNGVAQLDHFYPATGYRDTSGALYRSGEAGYYWSATLASNTSSYYLYFDSSTVGPSNHATRALGFSVRCRAE